MPVFGGKVRKVKGSVSAKVIKADGRVIDLGLIAGDTERVLTKEEKKELKKKLKQLEKEARNGG